MTNLNDYKSSNFEMTYFSGLNAHYLDSDLELYFDFEVKRVSFQVNNISNDTLFLNLNNILIQSDSLVISTISERLNERSQSSYKLLDKYKESGKVPDTLKSKIDSLFTIKIPPTESYRDLLLLKYSQGEIELIQSDVIGLIETAKKTVGTEYKILFPFEVGRKKQHLNFLIRVRDYYVLRKGS